MTDTVVVEKQPVGKIVYDMTAVPIDAPVTAPVIEPIDAIPGLLLLQVPPGVASLNILPVPTHIARIPDIGPGLGYTVTVVVLKHPVVNE